MRVIIEMPDELVAKLDAHAMETERSRAWVVRHACQVLTENSTTSFSTWQPKYTDDPEPNREHSFVPQPTNALRCLGCGRKKGEH